MAVSKDTVLRGEAPVRAADQPATGDDWTKQVADVVESVVSTLRNRTTVPLTTVARAAVYGLVAAVLGLTALVFLVVALVRFLDSYLPGDVWLPYAILGIVFVVAGLFIWRRRQAPLGPQVTSGRPEAPKRRR